MNNLIETWLRIGRSNPWIREAEDPEFTEKSFSKCSSKDEIIERFEHGDWCLGQAFYFQDLCFINQVDGGDEWLVIKDDTQFESCNCGYWIEKYGKQDFLEKFLNKALIATKEELEDL